MKYLFLAVCLFLSLGIAFSQDTADYCPQPLDGPGGADYQHDSVAFFDYAAEEDGFWLFEPASPKPTAAPVVIFLHGYGAFNPMVYGKWIGHLVKKGNIVVFPRYQKSLFSPSPKQFIENVETAIDSAYNLLAAGDHVCPDAQPPAMVGHSFGGAIAANMMTSWNLSPGLQPEAVFLVSPGTGPWKKFWLDSYENFPKDCSLLIMVSDGDWVVGDEFAHRVFETAVNTPDRNLIRQFEDSYGDSELTHGHNECCAPDDAFDSGYHGRSWRRSRHFELNPIDYNGYWKLFDALIDCTRYREHCEMALGGSEKQTSLGYWEDGTPIRPLEVILPEEEEDLQAKQ